MGAIIASCKKLCASLAILVDAPTPQMYASIDMSSMTTDNSAAIFQQLAALRDVADSAGVKTVIENHDAWLHAEHAERSIPVLAKAQVAYLRSTHPDQPRLERQCRQLSSLVVRLPVRVSLAG